MEKIPFDFSMLEKNWPSSVVARTSVREFTGGTIHEKVLANEDCNGTGPKNRFRIGRKVVYPVRDFIAWLEARSAVIPERTRQTK